MDTISERRGLAGVICYGLGDIVEALALWSFRQPGLLAQLRWRVNRTSRADQCVAAAKVKTVPRRIHVSVHGVEPQRNLGELNSGSVQVYAVNLVKGDVRFYLLEFFSADFSINLFTEFFLTHFQIEFCQLTYGFHSEGAGAHGWLTNLEGQDV